MTNDETALRAPFPYFGGKSRCAAAVWRAFGDVRNYVEPFAGSLAVLLARPSPVAGPETVNDFSCHLVNAWRAIASAPDALAQLVVVPVAEVNTEAQHNALMSGAAALRDALGDPRFFDLEAAAHWLKGANEWIGSGWCSNEGPWQWTRESGWHKGKGINRKLPHLGDAGTGINRQLPHLGNAGMGINRKLPHIGNAGRGINRKLPHLGNAGGELAARVEWVCGCLGALADRLCSVRIACGDWRRVTGPTVTTKHGLTAVFLDPPYEGTEYVYGSEIPVSQDVRKWCGENGEDKKLRIVLAGRGEEHDALLPLGWTRLGWKALKGYANHEERATETLWLSPNCVKESKEAFALGD